LATNQAETGLLPDGNSGTDNVLSADAISHLIDKWITVSVRMHPRLDKDDIFELETGTKFC
jgi:hypothetical protein